MQTTEKTFKKLEDTTITEEIRQRALEQLNETDENREKCLAQLRKLLKEEKNLNANTSDEFLLQFLRSKKFNTEKAFLRVKKFYGHRKRYPNLYRNYTPKQNLKALKANHQTYLPLRTSEDCAIMAARIGGWDPKDIDIEGLLRFGILCHEKALQNPVTQISGIVTILDMEGFSPWHLLYATPTMIKCFVRLSLDCLPIRHRAIHVINNPSLFGILFSMFKPFITQKILTRTHIHGYNIAGLHKHVPPCILPETFGGTLGPFENQQFYDSLLDSEERFLEDQKYGYRVRKC